MDTFVIEAVEAALREDLGPDFVDITSEAVFHDECGRGIIQANESGILAGTELVARVFQQVDRDIALQQLVEDGAEFEPGETIACVSGTLSSIMAAERTALNFLAHLSGIATLTARYVGALGEAQAEIFDTRKTLPGLRRLEKQAVSLGGGRNHRFGLFDGLLIKDNHLVGKSITEAIDAARSAYPAQSVEVEVETVEQAQEAVDAGADIILFDNMDIQTLGPAIAVAKGKAEIEVSGGMTLARVRETVEAGAQRISVGEITQGAPPIDFSLTIEAVEGGR